MDNWTEEKKRDFIHHYQTTHFKENNPNNFIKSHYKRQSIHLLFEASKQLASNEATCHLLKNKLREYSAIVDKQNGVNNYASGVLDLVPPNSNYPKTWESKAKAVDLIRECLKPVPGECFNKTSEGCGAQKPTREQLSNLLKNRKPFPTATRTVPSIPAPKPVINASVQMPSTSTKQGPSFAPHKPVNPSTSRAPNVSRTRPDSAILHAIESRVFGTGRGPNQPAKQESQPRPPAPSFRTAGTELKIQNMKKYGHQGGSSGGAGGSGGGDSLVYGTNKRSLGGRTRSVNSKFVPPVKSNSQEDNSQPDSCDEVEDERLRLVEPKMVELIRSEIMDQGPPVSWDDIAGLHFAKATIQEIVVLPMLRPDIFTGLRRPPKGILLFGPPGTGKTLIGKCIASQSKSTFFNISASSLTSKWVGEGEKMVRTLFTLARVHQPAVVFIDEIDSLLSQRSETEHESSRRIKTEFLVQLDGAGTGEDDRILVIGATNRPQELDEAARRRLVKRLYIPLPDLQARCQIVQNLMSTERNMLTLEQVEEVARLTDGFSGADMKTVCQEACLGPIRAISFSDMQHITPEQVRPVMVDDFKVALSRVRSSVSPKDLDAYVAWDQTYGSGGAPK